jgi:hypothetical protein
MAATRAESILFMSLRVSSLHIDTLAMPRCPIYLPATNIRSKGCPFLEYELRDLLGLLLVK